MHKAEHAQVESHSQRAGLSLPGWSLRRWSVPLGVMASVLVFDQLTKWQVREWLGPGHSTGEWHLIGTWLGFDYVENTGAAFGALSGQSQWLMLGALVVVALATAFYARLRHPGWAVQLGLGLLLGGAFGNIIDRVSLGFVVDFVAVGLWPRFNVADSAVTIGVILIVWKLGGPEAETK